MVKGITEAFPGSSSRGAPRNYVWDVGGFVLITGLLKILLIHRSAKSWVDVTERWIT